MKLIASFIISLLIAMPITLAQEFSENLPNAGITPDSPIYGLERAMEKLRLAITLNSEKRAELKLKYAEERLAEIEQMRIRNRIREMERAMNDYEEGMKEIEKEIQVAKNKGINVTYIMERLQARQEKHLAVLQKVLEKVPESAKPAISIVINNTEQRQERIREQVQERLATRLNASVSREQIQQQTQNEGKEIQIQTKLQNK